MRLRAELPPWSRSVASAACCATIFAQCTVEKAYCPQWEGEGMKGFSKRCMIAGLVSALMAAALVGCAGPECPACGANTTEEALSEFGECESCDASRPKCSQCGAKLSEQETDLCTSCLAVLEQSSSESQEEPESSAPEKAEEAEETEAASDERMSSSGDSKFTTCPECGDESLRTSVENFGMCQTCYVEKEMDAGRTDFSYSGGSSSSSGGDYSSVRGSEDATSCPICGGSTTESQIIWQGMCKSCFSTYESLQGYRS